MEIKGKGITGGPRSRAAAALLLTALLSLGGLRADTEAVGGSTWTYRTVGGAAEVVPADGDLVGVFLMCHPSLVWGEVGRFYVHLGEHAGIVGLRVVAAPDLVAELRARKGL